MKCGRWGGLLGAWAVLAYIGTSPVRAAVYQEPYGINSWDWSSSGVNSAFVAAGIKHARLMVHWFGHQTGPTTYDWSYTRTNLQRVRPYNLKVTLALWGYPDWARQNPSHQMSCDPVVFAQFVTNLLTMCEQEYPNGVVSFEWNEDPVQSGNAPFYVDRDPSRYYVAQLTTTYRAVQQWNAANRSGAGQQPVKVGITSIWGGAFHHLDELYHLGAGGKFDYTNWHYYVDEDQAVPTNNDPFRASDDHVVTQLRYLQYLSEVNGVYNFPIWVTEFGYRYCGEALKAQYTIECLETFRRSGIVERHFYYDGNSTDDTISLIYNNPQGVILARTTAYWQFAAHASSYPVWNSAVDGANPLPPLPAARYNARVGNPGFEEQSREGWYGTYVICTSTKYSGNACAHVIGGQPIEVRPESLRTGQLESERFPVEANRLYEITGWLKVVASTDNVRVSFDINYWNGVNYLKWGGPYNYYGLTVTDKYPGGWRRLRQLAYAPSSATAMSLAFNLHQSTMGPTSAQFWMDDIAVRALDFAVTGSTLTVTPTAVDAGSVEYGTARTVSFEIYNTGPTPLAGTISTNRPWLRVDRSSVQPDGQTVQVTVDNSIALLSSGTHSGVVTVQTGVGTRNVNVTFTAFRTDVPQEPSFAVTDVGVYPIPFRQSATFAYTCTVPHDNAVITVYDMMHRPIKTITVNGGSAGRNTVIWSGTNNAGEQVASGVYWYTLEVKRGSDRFTHRGKTARVR